MIRCILLLWSGKIHTLSMSSGALKNQPKQRSGRAIALQAPPPLGPGNRNWFLLLPILTTFFGPVFDNFVNCSLVNWQFKFRIHAQVLLLQFWYSSYYWAAFSNDLKKNEMWCTSRHEVPRIHRICRGFSFRNRGTHCTIIPRSWCLSKVLWKSTSLCTASHREGCWRKFVWNPWAKTLGQCVRVGWRGWVT